ncbi:MAG: hypothetical protein GTO45_30445 [Candidatus Aminicenantes bacterium]|nr:hypothetical protein [Candidatus Aminicenantes bacterium]NIM83114.1 hypothetical protein [Candidatus Aminicenantes bacterium]NIN22493.1 hypothetical protein [Candidatus Aminicenantes bacterium]NIN46261.1 hypothetical protein [Candidatus Aminicenantes bacterium]NIN89098.1 hypothetical protein [Candidatus Aminicenantes bacterium]
MKNLPPLTKVMDKGPESGFEFMDRENNSQRLKTQLESFKRNYPEYYKLIGFRG